MSVAGISAGGQLTKVAGGGGGGGTVTSVTASAPLTSSGGATPNIALAPVGQAQGDLLYFDGAAWTRLAAGTAGNVLQTGGAGANPSWVTSSAVPTSRTLTGTSPIAIDGSYAAQDLSANRTLSFAIASEAQGDLVYRNATGWVRLAAGTSGNVLTTQGAGANPTWAAPGVPSTRTVQGTTPIAIDGDYAAHDLSANRTWSFAIASQAQGDTVYYNGANWVRLAAGTSGFVLYTNGAGANPTWDDPVGSQVHKPTARAVATTNVAALSGTLTIDGVALVAGDVLLLTAQGTGAQNGPWVVAAGAWARPTWFDTSAKVVLGLVLTVREGTGFANTGWQLTNTTAPTLGVTTLTFLGVPIFGVQYKADNSNLLVWRRSTTGTQVRNVWADSAGNVSFGDTTAAATLLVGNNDIRLTTTNSAGNSASNVGISNTLILFNMASGISAIDTMQITSTPSVVIGQRDNTTAAVPLLVPIRGTEPASTQTDTAPSGQEIGLGRGRGTGQGVGTLTGYDPIGTGTTLQSTKRTAFSWRSRYVKFGTGRARNRRSDASATPTISITDDMVWCTNNAGAAVNLPAANAVPDGWEVWIADAGNAGLGSSNVLVSSVGGDTLNGLPGTLAPGRMVVVVSDGVSAWIGWSANG